MNITTAVGPLRKDQLRLREELDANAMVDFDGIGGCLRQARGRIDLINADLSSVLTGNQHPLATRTDVEVSRDLDVPRDMSRWR